MRRGWAAVDRSLVVAGVLLVLLLYSGPVIALMPHPIGGSAQQFQSGIRTTIGLTALSAVIGLVAGLAFALMSGSRRVWLRAPTQAIIQVLRGTPLLVQLLFVYLGLPSLVPALTLDALTSAVIALSLNVGAYNAEVIRGALLAVPRGQVEAARSLGLSAITTLALVVAPQALRIALPSLVNNVVALAKDSSLAYAIGVVELTNIGNRVSSSTFLPVPVLMTTAAVYFLITSIIAWVARSLEQRLAKSLSRN